MALAQYAMRDSATEGRRHPERPHPYRSEYQRDRDRIIHTKAFRRLEKKTQVFEPDYSDHFRNRLTHTLEVSQISRTISAALGLNSGLCEVLALSHDIGHPPFSHEGERVLDQVMRQHGQGFEHNLHALRIVEDFEEKYPAFRGLNLTFEVREGIVKHSRDYQAGDESYVDLSCYRLGEMPPLEAQLIDVADEIAYNTADLDDGYDSGLLPLGRIREELDLFDQLWREVDRAFPQAAEKLKVSEVIRRMIDYLVTQLIYRTRVSLRENGIDSVEKVRAFPFRLFAFDPETGALNQELKRFLKVYLYENDIFLLARSAVRRQLRELFEFYLAEPNMLPPSHRSRFDLLGPHRAVCDYIAGMTDSFARGKYAEVLNYQRV